MNNAAMNDLAFNYSKLSEIIIDIDEENINPESIIELKEYIEKFKLPLNLLFAQND